MKQGFNNWFVINMGSICRDYPVFYWVFFCIFGLFIFRVCLGSILLDIGVKHKRFSKFTLIFMIMSLVVFIVLIYFTITKSYGLLIYPCLFTWLATFYTIFIVFKNHKQNNKPSKIKTKKKPIIKVKANKTPPNQIKKSIFLNYPKLEKDIIKRVVQRESKDKI
ncbi:hypothetical protein [Campylobacter sputorum]|uniref:hypothetical protein n=1 Tax=Campylobacter sputorum TaxID=206 RepID=UPI000B7724EC|nr:MULTISPECIES: hypothetical protein [Campylobacter]ASM40162.1 hypothetical protein CSPB_0950 [Campylobacter sputorum]MBF6675333.1 hypothetical protein [Campylobacter sp. RM13538]MBF6676975.1 hypothetical protein [Campylobacter sp. RM12321]MBF6678616.1 hypothetical protein [Campylobacter sp. RM11259]